MGLKLSPAQKLDLVLAHPQARRTAKNSFLIAGTDGKTRRLHAMYSALYPRQFLSLTPAPGAKGYHLSYHEIGQAPGYSPARCEVGIVCPIQWREFLWADEAAKFAANIVTVNTARLAELSPCVVSAGYGSEQTWCYIREAWSRDFKESLFEEYSWHNAWLASMYLDHADALEANPKCTTAQYQYQLAKAEAVGGLRPELAAKWQAKSDAQVAAWRAPVTLPSGEVVPYMPR